MSKYQDQTIYAYGLSLISSYLLDEAAKSFKTDNLFYCKRNKFLVNELVAGNKSILEQAEQIRLLTHPRLQDIKDDPRTDPDAIKDEIGDSLEIIRNFIELYLKSSPAELVDLWIILDNLKQGKKVYTENEVADLVVSANNPQLMPA